MIRTTYNLHNFNLPSWNMTLATVPCPMYKDVFASGSPPKGLQVPTETEEAPAIRYPGRQVNVHWLPCAPPVGQLLVRPTDGFRPYT